jgi:hypothetical protein
VHVRKIRELNVSAASQPGRPPHVSAASGLVKVGSTLYVIADDELHVGAFNIGGDTPGQLIRVLPGELPLDVRERKKAKPDFEALTRLPAFAHFPEGAVLALGSGSRTSRYFGVMIPIDNAALSPRLAQVMDASSLFARLASEVENLNIEGAVTKGNQLLLLHRGNKSQAANAVFTLDLPSALRSIELKGVLDRIPIQAAHYYELGDIDGIPLCFTDGAALSDGGLLFSAVAEDTSDNYRDGPCAGAAIGRICPDGSLAWLERVEGQLKIEGVHAEQNDGALEFLLVTDGDNIEAPAALLQGEVAF